MLMKKLMLLLCAALVLLAPTANAKQVPAKGYVTPADGLNIRTGPSTSHKIIIAVNQGSMFTILSVSGDWYKVQYGSITGYSYSQWIKVTEYKEVPDETPTQSARDINLSAEKAKVVVQEKQPKPSPTMPQGNTARETNMSISATNK